MTAKQRCDVTRTPSVQRRAEWRRVIAVLAILFVAALASSAAQSLPLVAFEWDPAAQDVLPGTTQVSVDLVARQSEDADAAGLTLGFTVSGVVTGVALGSFGAAVSASDSFFGDVGGEMALIAAAPSTPGSFGVNVDVVPVATLLLTLDTSLGTVGAVVLKDLSTLAGPPALGADGMTEFPVALGGSHVVTVVPEPGVAFLMATGLAGLGLIGSRRRASPGV